MGNNERGHTAQSLIKADKRRKRHKIFKRSYLILCLSIISMLILATVASATSRIQGESDLMNTAFTVLEILIALIGGGLALWGIVNLLEGYGNDNPGAKSQGMKQLMAGAGVILIAVLLVPALETFFNANY